MPASIPKKVIADLAGIAKQTGEAVVKEPAQMAKTVSRQVGLAPSGDRGIEKPQGGGPGSQPSAQQVQKQIEEQKKLKFYRQQLQKLTTPLGLTAPEEAKEPEEAPPKKGLEIIAAPGGATKRGTALLGARKKGKGSGEVVAPTRSR